MNWPEKWRVVFHRTLRTDAKWKMSDRSYAARPKDLFLDFALNGL